MLQCINDGVYEIIELLISYTDISPHLGLIKLLCKRSHCVAVLDNYSPYGENGYIYKIVENLDGCADHMDRIIKNAMTGTKNEINKFFKILFKNMESRLKHTTYENIFTAFKKYSIKYVPTKNVFAINIGKHKNTDVLINYALMAPRIDYMQLKRSVLSRITRYYENQHIYYDNRISINIKTDEPKNLDDYDRKNMMHIIEVADAPKLFMNMFMHIHKGDTGFKFE
jgi:hypothetical protein